MASIESKLFYILLRLINKKKFLEMQFAFGRWDFNNSAAPTKQARKICNIETSTIRGRNVFVLYGIDHRYQLKNIGQHFGGVEVVAHELIQLQ